MGSFHESMRKCLPFEGFKRILHHTQSGALDVSSIFIHSIILRLIWYGGLAVYILSWYISIWLAKVLKTGSTGVVMRGVSELLPVSELKERRRQQPNDRQRWNDGRKLKV